MEMHRGVPIVTGTLAAGRQFRARAVPCRLGRFSIKQDAEESAGIGCAGTSEDGGHTRTASLRDGRRGRVGVWKRWAGGGWGRGRCTDADREHDERGRKMRSIREEALRPARLASTAAAVAGSVEVDDGRPLRATLSSGSGGEGWGRGEGEDEEGEQRESGGDQLRDRGFSWLCACVFRICAAGKGPPARV